MDIQKVTLRIGKRLLGTSNEPGAWAGLPAESLNYGAEAVGGAVLANGNTVDQTAVNVEIPTRTRSDGNVHAIAIAPDSPIAECNLHIDGKGIHRIGIGAPFIGRIDDFTRVRFSPAQGIPALFRIDPSTIPTTAQHRAWVRVWECTAIEDLNLAQFGGGVTVAVPNLPLKLTIARGEAAGLVAAVQKRSGYHAEMLFRGDGTNWPSLIVVTDGRRRVRVRASRQSVADGGAACSLRVYGINHFKTSDGMTPALASGLIDSPSFDELMPETALVDDPETDLIFDYEGNPYFAFVATITDGAAGFATNLSRGSISVSAWDD